MVAEDVSNKLIARLPPHMTLEFPEQGETQLVSGRSCVLGLVAEHAQVLPSIIPANL